MKKQDNSYIIYYFKYCIEELIINGKYQHFKGKFYKLIGIAKNSENSREEFVVYQGLYDDNQIWIRLKENFLETVIHEGIKQPRFKLIKE